LFSCFSFLTGILVEEIEESHGSGGGCRDSGLLLAIGGSCGKECGRALSADGNCK
jgi:hypothetical protein